MIYEATDGNAWLIRVTGSGTTAAAVDGGTVVSSNRIGPAGRVDVIREIEAQPHDPPAPEPAPPPVWEREIWRACDEDRRRYIVVSDEHEIAYFNGENCTCEEDAARATLAAAAPQMKRAGDALEALLVDDYWQSDRLAAARDAWRAASRKAEGGGE